MIGNGYWASGISLKYVGDNYWTACVCFYDNGFCNIRATEGELRARYRFNTGDAQICVATLKADAERIGVAFKAAREKPNLYVERIKECQFPDNLTELLQPVADAIGFTLLVDNE